MPLIELQTVAAVSEISREHFTIIKGEANEKC